MAMLHAISMYLEMTYKGRKQNVTYLGSELVSDGGALASFLGGKESML